MLAALPPETAGARREAEALFALLGGSVAGVEQRESDGKYPGIPHPITAERFARHLVGDGAPISIACGNWRGTTGRVAIIDVDDSFGDRWPLLAKIVRAYGFETAALFTEGSSPRKGKLAIFFAREQGRDRLDAFVHRIVSVASREPAWVGDTNSIDFRPHRSDVTPGKIRLLGCNRFRRGPIERGFDLRGAHKGLWQVVPSDVDLVKAFPYLEGASAHVDPEPPPIQKAPLHRTIEYARVHGLSDEMRSHVPRRSFLLHVGREALRLHGDTGEGYDAFLRWCRDIKARTPWATRDFCSPTSQTKGDPLRDRVLIGTWHAVRRWAAHGTSLSPRKYEGTNHDVPSSGTVARRDQDVRRAALPLRRGRVLDTITAIAVAKGLDPRASGMSYREIATATGIPRMTVWRDVQVLVAEGKLVLHDRGLDYSNVVADDDSPTGCRVGLRMVPGVVPEGTTPDELLGVCAKRALVRRQRARVESATRLREQRCLIDESPNVVRLRHSRHRIAVAEADLTLNRVDHSEGRPGGLTRDIIASTPPEGSADLSAQNLEDPASLFDYAVRRLSRRHVCAICGSAVTWVDAAGGLLKCTNCHPPSQHVKNRPREDRVV